MIGHSAENPGCTDFTGRCFDERGGIYRKKLFLGNSRALFSLSLFKLLLNQSGTKVQEPHITLLLLNAEGLCQEVYIPFGFLGVEK